jgi:uncharacterized protein (DUF1800 family)
MASLSSRRSFFENLFKVSNELAVSSLEEKTEPLNRVEVYHLLRRCCFDIDTLFAETLIGKTAKQAVQLLIDNSNKRQLPLPDFDVNQAFLHPDSAGDEVKKGKQRETNLNLHFEQNEKLVRWWIDLIKKDNNSLTEKMSFFWSSHFTTQYIGNEPIPAQYMHKQNLLFRELFLTNFKVFLEKLTIDGAMLLYLNGSTNSELAANENYARELFELYSIGIGENHYTEDDIRQAAKILTGWLANYFIGQSNVYKPSLATEHFSTVEKTVFGVFFKVDYAVTQDNVYKNSIQKLMQVILDKKGDEVSKYMANKFYRYFVYSNPDNTNNETIKNLASFFKTSGFDVQKTLTKLLTSKHFFDSNNFGVQIKSPLEGFMGFSSHFDVSAEELHQKLIDFGQEPMNPPNVSGWKGYRSWINTKTLPGFIFSYNTYLNRKTDLEIGNWAVNKIKNFDDAYSLVENIALLFLGKVPNESRLKKLESVLLGGAPYYEWPQLVQNKENAGIRVKALLREMFKMPDFYLA